MGHAFRCRKEKSGGNPGRPNDFLGVPLDIVADWDDPCHMTGVTLAVCVRTHEDAGSGQVRYSFHSTGMNLIAETEPSINATQTAAYEADNGVQLAVKEYGTRQYWLFGPNSNTFASTITYQC